MVCTAFSLYLCQQAHHWENQIFQLYPDNIENCSLINLGDNEPVLLECKQNCKGECYQAQYLIDKHIELSENQDRINIILNRDSLPDISIEYMPEMTLISLVCNIGGLVGMWCGISVLDTIKNIIIIIKLSYSSIKIKQNVTNRNITNITVRPRVSNTVMNVSTNSH